jgi:hypothetical protein
MKQGAYRNALARYKVIRFPDGIVEASLRIGNDDEALRYLLDEYLFESAGRYLNKRGKVRVSDRFIAHLLEEYKEEIRYGFNWEMSDIILEILYDYACDNGNVDTLNNIRTIFDKYLLYYSRILELSPFFFRLVLQIRQYNVIFNIVECIQGKEYDQNITSFIEEVKCRAEEENDPNLAACLAYLEGGEEFDLALEQLSGTEYNTELFRKNGRHFQKAVDFFVNKQKFEQAAGVYLYRRDHLSAGTMYERGENYIQAGRTYREGKLYDHALRCFLKAGDRKNAVRMCRRLDKLELAKEIMDGADIPEDRLRNINPRNDKQMELF